MPDRTINSQQAYEIAIDAVQKLVNARGADATFPFDTIWRYTDEDVPSTLRPGQAKRLINAGYLELTGRQTTASTPGRASSSTREYRPGPRFRGQAGEETPALRMPHPEEGTVPRALQRMERAMTARGFIITADQLANFYLALLTTPLVILAGTSGTGKSRLPRLFAELIGASSLFKLVSVQPQWSDNADLFGYTSSLGADTFIEGKFTRAMLAAAERPDLPAIVLLDEMNLAAVEHYFSDFLSVIETRRKEGGTIITDALPLDLPAIQPDDRYQRLRGLQLPTNVRIVGTANMDETTRPFSPKVLDRAFSIEFDDIDLTAFVYRDEAEGIDPTSFSILAHRLVDSENPISVSEVYPDSQSFFDRIAGLLEEIKTILKPAGITFGYRTRDAVCLYLWHWAHDGLSSVLPLSTAFDLCVLQKVLPKIHGTGESLRLSLEHLIEWLERPEASDDSAASGDEESVIAADEVTGSEPARPCLRSAEKVRRMLQQLNDEGATTYWST